MNRDENQRYTNLTTEVMLRQMRSSLNNLGSNQASGIHVSSEYLPGSRDIKFLEMSSLMRTNTQNSIDKED
jgi:hypothetical protein